MREILLSSGCNPCSRCLQRQVSCVYPSARKRKARNDDTEGELTSSITKSASSCGLTNMQFHQSQQHIDPNIGTGPILNPTSSGVDIQIEALNATSISITDKDGNWLSSQVSGDLRVPSPGILSGVLPEFEPSVLDNDLNEWLGNMASVNWLSPQDADSLFPDGHLENLLLPGIGNGGFELEGNPNGVHNPRLLETVDDSPGVDNTDTTSISMPSLHSTGDQKPIEETSPDSQFSKATTRRSVPRSTEGTYYIEGGVGRAPFRGRSSWRAGMSSNRGRSLVESTETGSICSESNSKSPPPYIPTTVYQCFSRDLAEWSNSSNNRLEIPTQSDMLDLVRLYFDGFHPTYPFLLQSPSIFNSDTDSVLLLAVAATGSRYGDSAKYRDLGDSLISIVGDVLYDHIKGPKAADCEGLWKPVQKSRDQKPLSIVTLQAMVLNCLFLLHSGKQSAVERALDYRYHIIEAFHSLNFPSTTMSTSHGASEGSQHDPLKSWIESESRIRTGWMVWLLDSIIYYEFHCSPLIQLGEMNARLPCRDDIWGMCWRSETTPGTKNQSVYYAVTLMDALETLYIEKTLPSNLSDLSTNILIFAICRRTREAGIQHQTGLTFWSPNAQKQTRRPTCSPQETWPPELPSLSKWRNAACDCLDILHWNANSTAARIGGWEPPTILNLHLARLVLLAPIRHIQTVTLYPKECIDLSTSDSEEYMSARYQIFRWAIRDQYKARLSIIHAGALLWHVRRYSTNSFMEPFAVYAATLVIWAYSVSMQIMRSYSLPRPRTSGSQPVTDGSVRQEHPSDFQKVATETEDSEVEFEHMVVQLDRPCDDEIVQAYVRTGERMSARLHRVGDIGERSAPGRILKQGMKLLTGNSKSSRDSFPGWGVENSYRESLNTITRRATSPEMRP